MVALRATVCVTPLLLISYQLQQIGKIFGSENALLLLKYQILVFWLNLRSD